MIGRISGLQAGDVVVPHSKVLETKPCWELPQDTTAADSFVALTPGSTKRGEPVMI